MGLLFFASSIVFARGAVAQSACGPGSVSGSIVDPSGAPIGGAQVLLRRAPQGELLRQAQADGRFRFACLAKGRYRLSAQMQHFSPAQRDLAVDERHLQRTIVLTLAISHVVTDVQVTGANSGLAQAAGPGATTLDAQQLAGLAADPEDFERQLQALATAAGGTPGKATITVDGFQNGGKLPPKSSIAEVRINPDLFSAEYGLPPYAGGRIEAYTKPGQNAFHGSVSGNYGGAWFNARDPLAAASTPASDKRFEASLTGPLLAHRRADFALDLAYRHVAENATVDATVLSPAGGAQRLNQVVPAPQSLWLGNGRTSWQAGEGDTVTASFAANVTSQANAGAGGLVLPEAGYAANVSQFDARVLNALAFSPSLLHTTRLGFTWKTSEERPNATAPGLQVAGAFTAGGSLDGHRLDRERDLEFDDDLALSRGRHAAKFGVQFLAAFINDYDPQGFNGAFLFGGATANQAGTPGLLPGLEQYRRALAGQPGGNPTTYSITSGNPAVPLQQVTTALFAQDQWQATAHLSVAAGLRFFTQTAPDTGGTFAPRLGLAWVPGRRQTWIFHVRAGLFYSPIAPLTSLQTIRLNGSRQQVTTIYSPSYFDPLGSGRSAAGIAAIRRFEGGLGLSPSFQSQAGVEHALAHGWRLNANYYYAAHWGMLRSRNINAPLVSAAGADPQAGPRPFAPHLDIFQYEDSGRLAGSLAFVSLNHTGKRFTFLSGYLYSGLRGNADSPETFPQSSYSRTHDTSRLATVPAHSLFAILLWQLPLGIAASANLAAASGMPYDVTTGFDNNGDGVLNDRPGVVKQPGPGVYATPFGWLTAAAVNGDLIRNAGTMPATLHLDGSLGREWKLGTARTLRFDVRSANLLNHTNVTAVNGVLGAPGFTAPVKADYGRRVELGLRFAF